MNLTDLISLTGLPIVDVYGVPLTRDIAVALTALSGGTPEHIATVAAAFATPQTDAEHRESERLTILAALDAARWNKLRAAEALGMPRRTFYRRLAEYGILDSARKGE